MLYVVQPGDSLYLISRRFGIGIPELISSNQLLNSIIYVGQRLFIPHPQSRPITMYTVEAGDTLDSIAQKFNTTKQAIMQLNNLSNDLIVPGQKLQIETRYDTHYSALRPIVTYTVEVNDTLDSIAQKFNTTKQAIMQLNNMPSKAVVPGQRLKIEVRTDIPNTLFRPIVSYTVQVSDTLDTIAKKFNTTKQAIM